MNFEPYWHDHNPWKDEVVYLPNLAELSGLLDLNHPLRLLHTWDEQYCLKVDAYILPSTSGRHSIAIRYGREPEDYQTYWLHKAIIELLLFKYGGG